MSGQGVWSRAAEVEGRSISDFVVDATQRAARQTIAETHIVRLATEDQLRFVRMLLDPPPLPPFGPCGGFGVLPLWGGGQPRVVKLIETGLLLIGASGCGLKVSGAGFCGVAPDAVAGDGAAAPRGGAASEARELSQVPASPLFVK